MGPLICWNIKRGGPNFCKGRYDKNDQDIEDFINSSESFAPKRFRYSSIKRMTKSFREKLGQGGFGTVYKGVLPNGTPVAVKLLNSSKGDGKDFINEVASISRTSHVNIVSLLGFCFEGRKRALIYEYMSNGSLDKFIYDDKRNLGWERLYQIAVGIARGLDYLHRGCNTRILHFDIKPQNILLDTDYCPKISDFGLSKLCLKRESVVSMLVARGTIGYIAPEVVSSNFGGVSHKSDVYSYGMMLVEMVIGRKNLNAGADQSSEVYFHDQVYQLVEQWHEPGLAREQISTPQHNEIARKLAFVGLWCIQADPSWRPSMSGVIQMLEGSTEALQIPPKPFPFYPAISRPIECSSSTI